MFFDHEISAVEHISQLDWSRKEFEELAEETKNGLALEEAQKPEPVAVVPSNNALLTPVNEILTVRDFRLFPITKLIEEEKKVDGENFMSYIIPLLQVQLQQWYDRHKNLLSVTETRPERIRLESDIRKIFYLVPFFIVISLRFSMFLKRVCGH